MNVRELEYLIAVAEERHFGRAADRCHVSQPTLSGQLRKFEDQLGITVFERSKRHVQLTEIGDKILKQARQVLWQLEEMQALAAAHRDPLSGTCSIGMPPTICPYLTPLLLAAIKHYLPDLQITFIEDLTDNLEHQLIDGTLDLAVLATRPAQPSLVDIRLYDEPFWVALPSGHPLSQSEAIEISDIDISDLLLLSDGHCLRDQIYEVCRIDRRKGRLGQGPKTQKTSLSTILSLVGAGEGITLVPAMSLSGGWLTDAGITVRREQSGVAGRTVRLTYRKTYHRLELVDRLADIIAGIVPDTVRPIRR